MQQDTRVRLGRSVEIELVPLVRTLIRYAFGRVLKRNRGYSRRLWWVYWDGGTILDRMPANSSSNGLTANGLRQDTIIMRTRIHTHCRNLYHRWVFPALTEIHCDHSIISLVVLLFRENFFQVSSLDPIERTGTNLRTSVLFLFFSSHYPVTPEV